MHGFIQEDYWPVYFTGGTVFEAMEQIEVPEGADGIVVTGDSYDGIPIGDESQPGIHTVVPMLKPNCVAQVTFFANYWGPDQTELSTIQVDCSAAIDEHQLSITTMVARLNQALKQEVDGEV